MNSDSEFIVDNWIRHGISVDSLQKGFQIDKFALKVHIVYAEQMIY